LETPLPEKEKKEFVLKNRHLSVEELSDQSGLPLRKVRKIIKKNQSGGMGPGGWKAGWGGSRNLWPAVIAALLTFVVYFPSLGNQFVNWDDPEHIQNNSHIFSLSFSSLQWMFTHFFHGMYMPLTWLSLALDYRLGGLNPGVFHLDNLVLHCANTVLVFVLSLRILGHVQGSVSPGKKAPEGNGTRWGAFLAAVFFGIHPIHVETVAWATERKDLLCALFFLSAVVFYLGYATRPQSKAPRYCASLLFFVMALLSKPMAVTLPLVLLLLDQWPLGRLRGDKTRVFLEKIPFFIASLTSGFLTIIAESQAQAFMPIQSLPILARVLNAFHSVVFYLGKMILPVNLAAFYPIPPESQVVSLGNVCWAFLVLVSLGFFFHWRRKYPFLMTAGLYYLITLSPVLGILQIGSHSAADRYAYLPSLGPFFLVSSLGAFYPTNRRWVLLPLTLALTAAMAFGTLRQSGTWRDSIALWENVTKVSPGVSVLSYTKLGIAYQDAGRWDDAIRAYDQALVIDPKQSVPSDWKGLTLYSKGLIGESVDQFRTAIDLDPRDAFPHANLSVAYQKLGRYGEALEEAEKAVQLDPGLASAYNNLGISYWYLKQPEKSIEAYRQAVALDPGNSLYALNLADVYLQAGQSPQAAMVCQAGIAANPRDVSLYTELGYIYYQTNQLTNAAATLQEALKLQPNNPDLYQKLGLTYEKLGQESLAAECFSKGNNLKSHN
jgi:tetratricopeptide (TPR) repeat protein